MKGYYDKSVKPYKPLIRLRVFDPLKTKHIELDFMIDTGFSGGILLPPDEYLKLNLTLYEKPKAIGKLATGEAIELRVSRAIIIIDNREIMCHAYTFFGEVKPLLGREVLNKTSLVYIPKKNHLEIRPDLCDKTC